MNDMWSYLKNLWAALLGRNLYKIQMESLRMEYANKLETIEKLKVQYCKCIDKIDEYNKQISNMQTLVENLRESVRNKEVLVDLVENYYKMRINNIRIECQRQIEMYSAEIDGNAREIG